MRFSLIVATLGRDAELRELFHSLALQAHSDFEVIVVDQNSDDRLDWTEEADRFPFPVVRKRSNVRRLSHARNVGLRAASGAIVAFPDDDCTYPPDLLAKVDAAFHEQPQLGVRTGPVVSPTGALGSGRWQKQSGAITVDNVWVCAISINIFMRHHLATSIGGFDERLGVGGEFGSGEDTDLAWRAVQSGWQGWYDTTQLAVHPDKSLTPVAVRRAFDYGAGFGYVLRKHGFPARVWLKFMLRPLGGCLLGLARGRGMNANYYWRTLCGRIYGFSAYRNQPQIGGVEGPQAVPESGA